MKVVVQKCKDAKVTVKDQIVGQISFGLVLLVAFTDKDNLETLRWMANKIVHLRIFEDADGVMNLSLLDQKGSILSISQFTLYGNCEKGNRPSYQQALKKEKAIQLYNLFNQELSHYVQVEQGRFGEEMELSFVNLGPTTILLER